MSSSHRSILHLLATVCVFSTAARAADIVADNVTSALGPDFFLDDAVTGGGDNNATIFTRDLTGFYPDSSVLVENLGGGLYRATAPATPGAAREFYRFQINQP